MKKVFKILIAVALVCGVVYLGIIIFNSTTVKDIEIVGNVQQIYFSGDDVNFGDAKLMVTYQNGTMKMIDMNNNVKVSSFSTSGHGVYFGTMKLSYKTQVVSVDYSVIDRTSYEIDNSNLNDGVKRVVEFKENGICRYFEIKNGRYYLNDGRKDNTYNYQIEKDKIIANLGKNGIYEIETKIDGNKIEVVSKVNEFNNVKDSYTKFKVSNDIKTNNFKEEKTDLLEFDYSKIKFGSFNKNNKTIVYIPIDGKIDDVNLYIKVDYDNGEIFYVNVVSTMINSNSLENDINYFICVYEGRMFKVYYCYK